MTSNAYKDYIQAEGEFALMVFTIFVLVCIFIGWLIPIPSPWEKSETPVEIKQKAPTKVAPPMPKKEVLIDLNEDGIPEWYVITPLEVVNE